MKKSKKSIYLYINVIYNLTPMSLIKDVLIYDCAIICNNEFIKKCSFEVDNYTQFIKAVKNTTLEYYNLRLAHVNTISINDICLTDLHYTN